MTLTLPALLAARVANMPGLNVSGVLQKALWALVDCRHEKLVCTCCAQPVDVRQRQAEALSLFYGEVMDRLEQLVHQGATAEGAARAVRQLGETHRCADRRPLPRPTRAERQTNNDRRWLNERNQQGA
jgi:hypothetical protein